MEKKLTLAEEVKAFLYQNGMFESQAEDVFNLLVKDESMEVMKGRWGDKAEDYGGAPMLAMVKISVKPIALKYIDENCPQAWFRPMFLPFAEQKVTVLDGYNITKGKW